MRDFEMIIYKDIPGILTYEQYSQPPRKERIGKDSTDGETWMGG